MAHNSGNLKYEESPIRVERQNPFSVIDNNHSSNYTSERNRGSSSLGERISNDGTH